MKYERYPADTEPFLKEESLSLRKNSHKNDLITQFRNSFQDPSLEKSLEMYQ